MDPELLANYVWLHYINTQNFIKTLFEGQHIFQSLT